MGNLSILISCWFWADFGIYILHIVFCLLSSYLAKTNVPRQARWSQISVPLLLFLSVFWTHHLLFAPLCLSFFCYRLVFLSLNNWLCVTKILLLKSCYSCLTRVFNVFSTSWKQVVDGRPLLRFHDVVPVGREQHALKPLVLVVVSVRVFRTFACGRAFGIIVLSTF